MESFKLSLFVPSLNKRIRFKELTNYLLHNVLKYITNKDSAGLSIYFDSLILDLVEDKDVYKQLTNFDKFLILLQLKAINVKPELVFKGKKDDGYEVNYKLNLFDLLKTLSELPLTIKEEIVLNKDLKVGLTIPKKLYVENYEDVYDESIEYIVIKTEKFYIHNLTNEEKNKIFEFITGDNFKKVSNFLLNINNQTKNIFLLKKVPNVINNELKLNIFNNTLMHFLEILFYEDLLNFFEFMYVMVNKIRIQLSEFYKLVPSESLVIYNLYCKDIDAQNKEIEKMTSDKEDRNIVK